MDGAVRVYDAHPLFGSGIESDWFLAVLDDNKSLRFVLVVDGVLRPRRGVVELGVPYEAQCLSGRLFNDLIDDFTKSDFK
jgi:hypothetical protein